MVKNKNPAGRPSCSSTCKSKKAASQPAGSTDLAPLDDPAHSGIPPELQAASQGLGFPDIVYLLASVIFQNQHLEKPAARRLVNYGKERGLPLPEVKDKEMQRAAYQLAFSALQFQELLEDIMIDSRFYLTQPMPDDQMSLVAIVLYDFQDRKFLPRERQGKEVIREVREVENYLRRFKTKLAASLAHYRIRHKLPSIEFILPESLRTKQKRSSSLPLYAWVNSLKSSLDEVQHVLKSVGFSQVKSIGQLEGQTFCQDPHCGDVLVLPAQLKAQLYSTKLLSDHKLIIQDKFCSLGPNAVCSLLPEEGDALMVGCFSALTVFHAASLVAEKLKGICNGQPTVYVCVSNHTHAQREDLQHAVASMGCKNVKLIPEDFLSLDSGDKRLQRVRVILLTPKCSLSAVSNPVEFILQENGDTDVLQDLSQGTIAQSKLQALVAKQRKDIDHALMFPKVLAVVYSTCSSYPEENKEVVSRALEQTKAHSEQEGGPKQANFRLSPTPFGIVDQAEDPFFMLEPSEESNGCFLAVLDREPDTEVKEAPHEVLCRAFAKGILDGIAPNHQLTRKEKQGHANRKTKISQACTSQLHLSVKNQETKGSDSSGKHVESTNRQQSSQGKAKASKNTLSRSFSFSKQESSPFSSKPENNMPKKNVTPVFNTTASASASALLPTPPPAPPSVPVVRPRRAHKEVLKPVVLVLPPVHFPCFFPAQHSRTGCSTSCKKGKSHAQTSVLSSQTPTQL